MTALLSNPLAGLGLALLAGLGVSLVMAGPRRMSPASLATSRRQARRRRLEDLLVQAGLDGLGLREFAAVSAVLFVVGALAGWALFPGNVLWLATGAVAAAVPLLSARQRRSRRLEQARDVWPRMIEELRIQAVSLGRSIPQALFAVGRRAPEEMRTAFAAGHREWMISTDFERTLGVLKAQLADPTADAIFETLLIAHEVGGTDVDRRLSALVDDRVLDLQGRKDARSKQAGARFARNFVLVVPLGMALVGQSIGPGAAAYRSAGAQVAVVVALGLIAGCWAWAGRLMRLPAEQRVFYDDGTP